MSCCIGTKPTFHDEGPRTVEAYILDFAADLYDQPVRLEFVRRLRGQERFESTEALVAQMHRDVAETRAVLGVVSAATKSSNT